MPPEYIIGSIPETDCDSLKPIYWYCRQCGDKAWIDEDHEKHDTDANSIDHVIIKGVYVQPDFVEEQEEALLVRQIDARPWVESQEGRSKQDYGPKINFLGRKMRIADFGGFPPFAKDLFDRMSVDNSKVMNGFVPVEFCILEYTPERGSYIRAHYDDTWAWGDRLITVNLLSDTVLRLTKEYYIPPYEIVIRMPARCLVVIYDEARYDWHHSIKKYDIKSRRIAMTWREFSDEILKDDTHQDDVIKIMTIANSTC